MSDKPDNHKKSWNAEDIKSLKELLQKNTPTRLVGLKLKRTEKSIQSKASELKLSLKPTNQSPYGTKK